jgi:hypothetical protein
MDTPQQMGNKNSICSHLQKIIKGQGKLNTDACTACYQCDEMKRFLIHFEKKAQSR